MTTSRQRPQLQLQVAEILRERLLVAGVASLPLGPQLAETRRQVGCCQTQNMSSATLQPAHATTPLDQGNARIGGRPLGTQGSQLRRRHLRRAQLPALHIAVSGLAGRALLTAHWMGMLASSRGGRSSISNSGIAKSAGSARSRAPLGPSAQIQVRARVAARVSFRVRRRSDRLDGARTTAAISLETLRAAHKQLNQHHVREPCGRT